MTDLQSVALATWLRSRRTVDRHKRCFELNLPNREIRNRFDNGTKVPAKRGRIVVVVWGRVNRLRTGVIGRSNNFCVRCLAEASFRLQVTLEVSAEFGTLSQRAGD